MKIWKDGDEARANCPTCERRTEVVFRRRDVELDPPRVRIPDVLVAVCRECDGVALIPQQSTPKLRRGVEHPKETVNVRVPGHLVDILLLMADVWAAGSKAKTAAVLRLLLDEFGNNPAYASRVKEHLDGELAQGVGDHGLSVRVPSRILVAVDEMAAMVGIATRSEVVRGALAAAKEDVLDEHDPVLGDSIRRALTAVG